jgi:hypothetical protein
LECDALAAAMASVAAFVSVLGVYVAIRATRLAGWALLVDAVPLLWPNPETFDYTHNFANPGDPRVRVEIVNAGRVPAVLVQAWVEQDGAKPARDPDHDSCAVIGPGKRVRLRLPVTADHHMATQESWEEALKPCTFVIRYLAPAGVAMRLTRLSPASLTGPPFRQWHGTGSGGLVSVGELMIASWSVEVKGVFSTE